MMITQWFSCLPMRIPQHGFLLMRWEPSSSLNKGYLPPSMRSMKDNVARSCSWMESESRGEFQTGTHRRLLVVSSFQDLSRQWMPKTRNHSFHSVNKIVIFGAASGSWGWTSHLDCGICSVETESVTFSLPSPKLAALLMFEKKVGVIKIGSKISEVAVSCRECTTQTTTMSWPSFCPESSHWRSPLVHR